MDSILEANEQRSGDCEKINELMTSDTLESQKELEELAEVSEINKNKMQQLIRDLTMKAKKEIEEERAIR